MKATKVVAFAAWAVGCSSSVQEAREHGVRLEVSSPKSVAAFARCSIGQMGSLIREATHKVRLDEVDDYAAIVSTGAKSDFLSVVEFTRNERERLAIGQLYLSSNVQSQSSYIENVRTALTACQ